MPFVFEVPVLLPETKYAFNEELFNNNRKQEMTTSMLTEDLFLSEMMMVFTPEYHHITCMAPQNTPSPSVLVMRYGISEYLIERLVTQKNIR